MTKPVPPLSERDVILIVLDSCRYDVATIASTPHLLSLGALVEAETSGTYTLPAHAAMFNGFLPQPKSGKFSIGGSELGAVWQSTAARPRREGTGIQFGSQTFIEHYTQLGYRVLGAGGVTFFDNTDPANWLPTLFPEFRYFGRVFRGPTSLSGRVVDRDEVLTLSHVDTLAADCLAAENFFLFVNCPCTHIPYTTPNSLLTEQARDVLLRLYELHDSKIHAPNPPPGLDRGEIHLLLAMQRCALEWADSRLGRLFGLLRHREPLVVVCADHGDEFGEDGRYGHGHPHPTVTTVPMWCGLLSSSTD